ncbi:uncharacterized protein [Choristoneura fumiferana]|uniref:uncharacterized protein n=1 Tax=Choristoneura fumiferana TaxID=7141 RepID=UPI003D15F09E
MALVNLVEANLDVFQKILDSFDHVFSDCDGVLWQTDSNTRLEGSGEFIKLMKQHGKKVHFLSNNSMRSKEEYQKNFDNVGIRDGFENLTVPSIAIAEYLKSVNFDKQIYCVTCPETKRVLESYGFKCKYGPDVGVDTFADYGQYLEDDLDIGAVVFDNDYKVNMPKMYKAQAYLRRPEVLFLNGATDKFSFIGKYSTGLGISSFVNIVAEYNNRIPIGLGKPSKLYGEFAMKRAKATDPSRVLFIGDMIEQDVVLGKNVGFKTLLVLTYFAEEAMRAHKIKPDFFATSLGHLVPKLKILLK